jgi:predicted nuclease of predicted toxin-antitoxin system
MRPRFLANENFPAPSVEHLREQGYDVVAVAESGANPGDSMVLAQGVNEQRWVITFDRDYGELIFARGLAAPPAVFLFRLRSYRPEDPGRVLSALLDSGKAFQGQFVLIEDGGFRSRPLPGTRATSR